MIGEGRSVSIGFWHSIHFFDVGVWKSTPNSTVKEHECPYVFNKIAFGEGAGLVLLGQLESLY